MKWLILLTAALPSCVNDPVRDESADLSRLEAPFADEDLSPTRLNALETAEDSGSYDIPPQQKPGGEGIPGLSGPADTITRDRKSDVWHDQFEHRIDKMAKRWVSQSRVEVRRQPTEKSSVIGHLQEGAQVVVEDAKNGWVRLRSGGFVKDASLSSNPPPPTN